MLQRKNYLRRIGVEKINKRSNAFELLRLVAMCMGALCDGNSQRSGTISWNIR